MGRNTHMRVARLVVPLALLGSIPFGGVMLAADGSPIGRDGVVQVEGATAAQLYARGKLWFAEAFIDSKNVLEVEDKETGVLVGKGTIPYEPNVFISSGVIRGHIGFTVKILVKDGRYKYTLTDFTHTGSFSSIAGPVDFGLITDGPPPKIGTKGWSAKVWQHLQQVSRTRAEELAASIRRGMADARAGTEGSDDW